MIHNISAVETTKKEGHPFLSVTCSNGKQQVITPRNIVSLEKNEKTPEEVMSDISFITKTLSIENCHVTPDELKLADHTWEKEQRESPDNIVCDCNCEREIRMEERRRQCTQLLGKIGINIKK